jgi:hypothetical protein
VNILLPAKCYELLLKHVPVDTDAYPPLAKAVQLHAIINNPSELAVDCSELDGELYLATAEQFFPECISDIERAITQAIR